MGETITNGETDGRSKFFREKLEWAMQKLEILEDANCSREDGLRAWDIVFNTQYFSGRLEKVYEQKPVTLAAILREASTNTEPDRAVSLPGNRRFG